MSLHKFFKSIAITDHRGFKTFMCRLLPTHPKRPMLFLKSKMLHCKDFFHKMIKKSDGQRSVENDDYNEKFSLVLLKLVFNLWAKSHLKQVPYNAYYASIKNLCSFVCYILLPTKLLTNTSSKYMKRIKRLLLVQRFIHKD